MAPTAATRDAEAQVFETGSGLEIQELYGPDDVPALDPERDPHGETELEKPGPPASPPPVAATGEEK